MLTSCQLDSKQQTLVIFESTDIDMDIDIDIDIDI